MKRLVLILFFACSAVVLAVGYDALPHWWVGTSDPAAPPESLPPAATLAPSTSPERQSDQELRALFAGQESVRPHDLTPLETRIQDLERRLQNVGRAAPPDDSMSARLKLELAELYAQQPHQRDPLDDGSDACPAVTIPAVIPFVDSGTTLGAVNNFNPITPCGTTYAPDKIYRFVPAHSGQFNINTFGSAFDTQLYVNTGGPCPGNTQVDCNDDFGGSQSQVTPTLTANQTYYIIVDGFQGYSGNFTLYVSDVCLIGNGSQVQQECAESVGDPSHAMFDCDGGCSNLDYGGWAQFQSINLCQWVHGSAFTYTGPYNFTTRDIDSYRFTLTEPCSLLVSIAPGFSANITIAGSNGCPETPLWSMLDISSCSGNTYLTPCFPAGTYSFTVSPNFYGGMTTPRAYLFEIDPVPCSGCRIDGTFTPPISFVTATCGYGSANTLRPSEEVTFCVIIPHTSDWTFSLCSTDPAWNSYMYVTTQCNGGIIAQDDNGCLNSGLSRIECLTLTAGNYYLTVEGANPTDCGQFYLSVTECAGACCYGDPYNPSCSYGSQSACAALSGQFNLGQQCVPGLCYQRPACQDDAVFSQQPHVPDETWSAFASDTYANIRVYENYSASAAFSAIRFWGVDIDYNTGLACPQQPRNFQISFIDSSSGPTVKTYNFTLTGTQLPLNYGANYPMFEWTAQLPVPCNILSGRVSIVGTSNDGCVFHWTTSPQGNSSVVLVNSGGPVLLARDMAVCLARGCPNADSLVIKPVAPNTLALSFHLYVPTYVRLYYSTDVNAAYPTNYSVLTAGSLGAGSWTLTDVTSDPQRRYVITTQCGPPPVDALPAPDAFRRIE
jgi:hypothetical protein